MKRKSKCLKDFYIRIPFHSYDFYKDNLKSIEKLNSKKFLDKLRKEKGELICSASNDLYDSLKNGKQDEEKKFLSSLKYLIRSSTRATPYGLLSGVAKGEFSDKEYLNINDFKKKASADLEWLINVAKKMEKRVGKQLRVCFNNSLICHEDVLFDCKILLLKCKRKEGENMLDMKDFDLDLNKTDDENGKEPSRVVSSTIPCTIIYSIIGLSNASSALTGDAGYTESKCH